MQVRSPTGICNSVLSGAGAFSNRLLYQRVACISLYNGQALQMLQFIYIYFIYANIYTNSRFSPRGRPLAAARHTLSAPPTLLRRPRRPRDLEPLLLLLGFENLGNHVPPVVVHRSARRAARRPRLHRGVSRAAHRSAVEAIRFSDGIVHVRGQGCFQERVEGFVRLPPGLGRSARLWIRFAGWRGRWGGRS